MKWHPCFGKMAHSPWGEGKRRGAKEGYTCRPMLKFSCRSFKISNRGKFRINRDPISKFQKKWIVWLWVPESRINLKFPWLLILPVLHEIFCLLRDYEWGYFSQTGILMLHMNDQSWNYPWRSATQLFLAWTDHQSWGFLSIVTCLQTTQLKTNQRLMQTSWFQAIFAVYCGLHSWHLLSFVFWGYGWVEIATLRLVIYSGCRSLIKFVSARSNRLLGMPQNLCRKVINGYILFS